MLKTHTQHSISVVLHPQIQPTTDRVTIIVTGEKKNSVHKWTHAVQIHVAQGSAVFSHGWQVFYTLMLNAEVAERGGQL